MTDTTLTSGLPDLHGSVAVVTGGGGGLGSAIARRFADAGAAVLVHYNSRPEAAEAVVAAITNAGGRAIAAQADLTDETQCARLMQQAVDTFGRLDHLVNNAGVQPVEALEGMTVAQWRFVMDTNTTSTFAATQAAVAHMGAGSTVTHIASIEGSHPASAHAHYCASKAAIVMHARTAALELGARGIRVNTVSPGLIDREGLAQAWPDGVASWQANAPLGRLGTGEDIGNACVFLASPLASWITGIDLPVSGGMTSSTTW